MINFKFKSQTLTWNQWCRRQVNKCNVVLAESGDSGYQSWLNCSASASLSVWRSKFKLLWSTCTKACQSSDSTDRSLLWH